MVKDELVSNDLASKKVFLRPNRPNRPNRLNRKGRNRHCGLIMILRLLYLLCSALRNFMTFVLSIFNSPRKVSKIKFDNGIAVSITTKIIGEGGFSLVFYAQDTKRSSKKYALKRILCPDKEVINACKSEAKVHHVLGNNNVNTLPLLGLKFDSSGPQTKCYMLFPLITGGSLRDEVSKRKLLINDINESDRCPLTEIQLLWLFKGILRGVMIMHDAGFAHRDIKLENVLLDKEVGMERDEEMGARIGFGNPVLMDFGSASPIVTKLSNRRTVLNLSDEAARNSTVSYRAPELFEGGCRHGPDEPDIDGKVDVWSCGCVLYGMMYGTSPFEMEFLHNGMIRIVECTYLRVLGGKIPFPPKESEVGQRYSEDILELASWILNVDRKNRPDLYKVLKRVEDMLDSNSIGIGGGALELI